MWLYSDKFVRCLSIANYKKPADYLCGVLSCTHTFPAHQCIFSLFIKLVFVFDYTQ